MKHIKLKPYILTPKKRLDEKGVSRLIDNVQELERQLLCLHEIYNNLIDLYIAEKTQLKLNL